MPEKLKEILQKVLDWWNKFTSRQKTLIVGLAATVVLAFVIVIYVINQPQYVKLTTCENSKKASEVQELLDGAGIKYRSSNDALTFEVEKSQYTTAVWTLGAKGYAADEYTIQDALLNSGISTTASDKATLTKKAYEDQVSRLLKNQFENIEDAYVLLDIPPQNGTLIREKQEAGAWIQLTLDGNFTSSNAAAVAKAMSTWLGNSTTSNITILDQDANLLFAGGDDYSSAGIANSMNELQNQGQSMISNQVKNVLLGTNQFSQVMVACSLDMDWSEYEQTVKEYYTMEGHDQGLYAHKETYESENNNNGAYAPGTDSNNETIYNDPDAANSSSTQTETVEDFLPDESILHTITPAGAIKYGSSAMTISLIRYREVKQEDVERQGLLDGITWEEYKIANGNDVKLEVDEDFYNMAHTATRIPRENITIVSYEHPVFTDKPGVDVEWTDILSVLMLIVILALLAFVVLRSMRSKQQVEEEEEISVDDMLQSTSETELEDIDVETKSETRKLIDKFVDENPEAAAALLRNWLGEDW